VGLINNDNEIVWEIVEERVRWLTRLATVHVHRVVFDAAAEPDLFHHLEIISRAHPQPLCLEQLVLTLQHRESFLQLRFDCDNSPTHGLTTGGVMRCRENGYRFQLLDDLAGQWVQLIERLDFVTKHLDANRQFFVLRDDLEGVTADPELSATEVDIVSFVLHSDELADDVGSSDSLANLQCDHCFEVFLGRTEPINAGHRRHDDDVPPRQQ
jgi:hypothetical protein